MSEHIAENGAPATCPVCHVVSPGQCRNEQGQKVWPPHWFHPIPPGSGDPR